MISWGNVEIKELDHESRLLSIALATWERTLASFLTCSRSLCPATPSNNGIRENPQDETSAMTRKKQKEATSCPHLALARWKSEPYDAPSLRPSEQNGHPQRTPKPKKAFPKNNSSFFFFFFFFFSRYGPKRKRKGGKRGV